jgi:hypothetical protein
MRPRGRSLRASLLILLLASACAHSAGEQQAGDRTQSDGAATSPDGFTLTINCSPACRPASDWTVATRTVADPQFTDQSAFFEFGQLVDVGPTVDETIPWGPDSPCSVSQHTAPGQICAPEVVTGPSSLSYSFATTPPGYWIILATGWAGPTSAYSWGSYRSWPGPTLDVHLGQGG